MTLTIPACSLNLEIIERAYENKICGGSYASRLLLGARFARRLSNRQRKRKTERLWTGPDNTEIWRPGHTLIGLPRCLILVFRRAPRSLLYGSLAPGKLYLPVW